MKYSRRHCLLTTLWSAKSVVFPFYHVFYTHMYYDMDSFTVVTCIMFSWLKWYKNYQSVKISCSQIWMGTFLWTTVFVLMIPMTVWTACYHCCVVMSAVYTHSDWCRSVHVLHLNLNNNDNNRVAIVLFKNTVITKLSTIAAIYTLLSFYNVDWIGVINDEIITAVTVVMITIIISVVISYCWF